jgi:hypothetical protein
MENLVQYFENLGFSSAEASRISSAFKIGYLKKHQLFVEFGVVSSQIGFLQEGILQYYSLTEKGEERTTYISLPGTFVASLLSYLSEVPARFESLWDHEENSEPSVDTGGSFVCISFSLSTCKSRWGMQYG